MGDAKTKWFVVAAVLVIVLVGAVYFNDHCYDTCSQQVPEHGFPTP